MGNDGSKSKKPEGKHGSGDTGSPSHTAEKRRVDSVWKHRFETFSGGKDHVTQADFDRFGDEWGRLLWRYFSDDGTHPTVDCARFTEKATPLFGSATDVYMKVAGSDAEAVIRVSSSLLGCAPGDHDRQLLKDVLEQIKSFGTDLASLVEWKACEAPRICEPLQLRFQAAFGPVQVPGIPMSSVVTPFSMFLIRSSIPASYIPPAPAEWTIIYSSASSGMSTSRFESCVFGYKGRTLTIIRASTGTYVIGVDQEWRHSASPFGGADSFLLKLSPSPITRFTGSGNLFCNLKMRSSKMGLSWKNRVLELDKDLSQVQEMEVWACGAASYLEEHAKLKQWQQNQTERHKKVPLPGNWDDNVDKTILEMAGFQFSNERKNDRPDDSTR